MRDIKGYEGKYAITPCGKVWIYKDKRFKKLQIVGNYKCVVLYKNGQYKNHLVHRLVAETYIPNPDNKPEINHINEITTDNYVKNLEWVTHSENCKLGTVQARRVASRGHLFHK